MLPFFERATLKKPRPYQLRNAATRVNFPATVAFNTRHPLIVEVGSGTGDWAIQLAQTRPECQVVAIERTKIRAQKLQQKAAVAALNNLVAIRADAILYLATQCPDAVIHELHLLHPNPCPCKRQANLRYVTGSGFWVLDRCLQPGGTLLLASNTLGYTEEAAEFLEKIWGYANVTCQTLTAEHKPRTAFERKYQERGQMIYEVQAQRPR